MQRSSAEHEQVFQILNRFPAFKKIDQRTDLLRQLVELAHLDQAEDNRQPGLTLSLALVVPFSPLARSDAFEWFLPDSEGRRVAIDQRHVTAHRRAMLRYTRSSVREFTEVEHPLTVKSRPRWRCSLGHLGL